MSLSFGRYHHKGEYLVLKVVIWLCGALFGLFVGKVIIHRMFLNGVFKLRLFRKNQGSWVVMFLTMIIMLYCFSLLFNHVTELDSELKDYYITNQMEIKYITFMKGVGLSSFFSHFLFVLMVTDTILQVIDLLFEFIENKQTNKKKT